MSCPDQRRAVWEHWSPGPLRTEYLERERGGKEGGREGGREGEREGGREGGREGEREGGEGGREGGREEGGRGKETKKVGT